MYPGQRAQQQQQQGQQVRYVQAQPQQVQPQQVVYQPQPQQGQQQVQYVQQPQVQYVQQPMMQQQPQVQYVQQPQVQYVQQPMVQQQVPQVQYVQQPMVQQQVPQVQYAQQPQVQYVQQPQVQQVQYAQNAQQKAPVKKMPPSYGQHSVKKQVKQAPKDDDDDEKAINNIYAAADQLKDLKLDAKTWEQPLPDAKGAVKVHTSFNDKQAMEDAKKLRKAMKGMGCDKKVVAAVTGARSHAQRLMIKNSFTTVDQELYGKGKNRDLMKDLKSELSGKLEDLVMACYMEPGEYDARLIKKACDGAGFNTDLLVETLCTRTNKQIELMKSAWSTCLKEKKSMTARCESETKKMLSGNHFQSLILTILKAKRPKNEKPNKKLVSKDAEELNRFITQAKKSEAKSKFVEVYTERCWAHIGAIADAFQAISKKFTLEAAIKKTFGDGSDTSKALRVITAFCSAPYDFWAQKLRGSMKGMGTDDHMLIRSVVARSEVDMDNVRAIFGKRYGNGKTLKNWIEADTSGAYKTLLCNLCGYE